MPVFYLCSRSEVFASQYGAVLLGLLWGPTQIHGVLVWIQTSEGDNTHFNCIDFLLPVIPPKNKVAQLLIRNVHCTEHYI